MTIKGVAIIKKKTGIIFAAVLILCFQSVPIFAGYIEWTCTNCKKVGKPDENYCGNCGKRRVYEEYVNQADKIDPVDGFLWDNSHGGISENFMFDLNTFVVATNHISFYFPESWDMGKGIQPTLNEKNISFFSRNIALSDSEEDGLLCMIYREKKEQQDKKEYYIGNDDEYWYYLETFDDHANPEDTENFEIYKAQSSGLDIIRETILIEGALETEEDE